MWFRFFEKGYKGYNIQEELYFYRENLEDFKKRNLKSGIMTSIVFFKGYKRINVPVWKRIYAVKPIISTLIPNIIMKNYHRKKDGDFDG